MRLRVRNILMASVLVSAAAGVGGCASIIADAPLIGLPADAPKRPAEPAAFPHVHDMPPERKRDTISLQEQGRLEAELSAARDRQAIVTPGKK